MSKEELMGFIDIVNSYNSIDFLFATIMWGAGPTLAKEKVSSLITFSNNNRNSQKLWEMYKDKVGEKLNIKFFELKKCEKNTVVLFYNEDKLHKILNEERSIEFLKRFGYHEDMTLEESLQHLNKRFENCCPHEMGIFLGYPIDDVTFFIDCPNKECKLTGYWKVYHNIEEAKQIFKRYDKIKHNIIRIMINGTRPTEIVSDGNKFDKYLAVV